MKVLLVGSGGREHALAWKMVQSPRLSRLFVAPGNAGTARLAENVPIEADDIPSLVAFACREAVDWVLVGPEAPLAAGLADELRDAGKAVFGPSRAAAQIEASKAFAKAFMLRHQIPTARYALFTEEAPAREYLRQVAAPVVIKASGLAAGKGVFVPETNAAAKAALHTLLVEGEFGAAGKEVIIEERLVGEEVSLLAFTDGKTVKPMPPAQDHKRLLDGDHGPNTGGMGAYAPAPVCPPKLAQEITRTFLQPAVDGLREEGKPFVGVLYAGLMLTAHGPRLLEFNCRFGDPETQAILPLLQTDLLDIIEACINGSLQEIEIHWKPGAAACVVLASENYPGKVTTGRSITGLDTRLENAVYFHAGTRQEAGRVVTTGGRVLGITGWGDRIGVALQQAYSAANQVSFEGMQYRRDIGRKASSVVEAALSAYAAAGVNIDAGRSAVELMREAVTSTYGPQVLAGIGAFGGLYAAPELKALQAPVLVASTDGVGTKVKLAVRAGCYETLGQDIVNHCINDILVQGARPLFFLDYIASSELHPPRVASIVKGMAAACREAGCALLGGETAEMPGVYAPGELDVVGTVVGIAERDALLPVPDLSVGDMLLGLPSSGPHTNGYSLIRKVFTGVLLETVYPELNLPLSQALLAPHRSYLGLLQSFLPGAIKCTISKAHPRIKALIHITGGGFSENIPRLLPAGVDATLRRGSWPVPPLFNLIQRLGQVPEEEMYRVFNMGIGMIVIVAPQDVAGLQAGLGEVSWIIGELIPGKRLVRWA